MTELKRAAPQFLVAGLARSLEFYEGKLGFEKDFEYEGFYASVSRGGAAIHLKCAPRVEEDRLHRKAHGHLDGHLAVSDVDGLYREFLGREVPILRILDERPWGRDFFVENPDGYILCFRCVP